MTIFISFFTLSPGRKSRARGISWHTDELLQDLKNQIGIIEKAFKDGKFEYCKEIIDSVLQKLKKIQGRNRKTDFKTKRECSRY